MGSALPLMRLTRKTGSEQFRCGNRNLEFTLLEFWQWSVSDLVSNATRGRLAEFIVAKALGSGASEVRSEWDPYDLLTSSGVKVEVKSAAYVQSWFQKKPSVINYVVPPRRGWDAATNVLDAEPQRHADVYVFALLLPKDKELVDPLDVSQWEFYIVPTSKLDERKRSQHSITLKSLADLCGSSVMFAALGKAIDNAARRGRSE